MATGRPKYNLCTVLNGKEVNIYTWTQASDSVLGFANAKYDITCSKAKSTMESAAISDFHSFDGLQTPTKSKRNESESANEKKTSQAVATRVEIVNEYQERV